MERRECTKVIAEMLVNIPLNNIELIEKLKWNFEDACYKAPEETIQWERTMQTLQAFMPHPKEDWEFKVLSIFTTRPPEDIKKMILAQTYGVD